MDNFEKVMATIFVLVISLVVFILLFSHHKEAEMYNSLNGTNYTMSDFLWAGDQINSQSQTIKLNN